MSKNLNASSAIDAQRKMLWALAVSASCIFLLGTGTLYMINNKIVEGDKIVAEKRAQVGTNEQIAKRYQSTLDTYNQTADKLRFLEPKMTHDAYVATMIQQLQQKADADGIKLASVRPSDETDPTPVKAAAPGDKPIKATPSPYTQLMCSVTVSGTYAQLMHFVYDLPRFPKILSVQGIGVRPASTAVVQKGDPILTADIGLIAYIFTDPSTTSSVGAATDVAAAGAPVQNVSYNSNPVAFAAGRATSVARADVKASNVNDRSGGLLDASKGSHSIQGGLGSEQQVPIR